MAVAEFPNVLRDNNLSSEDETYSYIKESNYYDIDEFCEIMKEHSNEKNISTLNLNARSLVKNINELNHYTR